MNIKEPGLIDFKYNDKRRVLFLTEQNDFLICGYELVNDNHNLIFDNKLWLPYFKAFNLAIKNKDDNMIKILKEGLNNLEIIIPFKKYKKDKVQQWY